MNEETVLITGGAGFIGSCVVRQFIEETSCQVINIDKLTYAGHLESVEQVADSPLHIFKQVDICDSQAINNIFQEYKPDGVLHLAAESHVDKSIDSPADFINTNVIGTYNLLEASRRYLSDLDTDARKKFRFLHVSTDEVYGSLGNSGYFTETTCYQPSSPYSASKASSDHLVRAWHKTYNLPIIITNCSNNYGPYQLPEKLIPKTILHAISGEPIPIYGQGLNIRDWLYVEDHARALRLVFERGKVGETYNIGGNNELTNIEIANQICNLLDQRVPRQDGESYKALISFVDDRPGHDLRYAIDATKIRKELGWNPNESFQSGIEKTVDWYIYNKKWSDLMISKSNIMRRQGLEKDSG